MEHDDGSGQGYRHVGHVRTRDEDLGAVLALGVRQAVQAGNPVLIVCPEPDAAALAATWNGQGVRVTASRSYDDKPASALAVLADLVDDQLPDDGRRLYLVTALEEPSIGWTAWMQTEALLNHVLADRPVDHLCVMGPADDHADLLPVDVARATHPFLDTGDGVVANPDYRDPAEVVSEVQRAAVPDPIEATEPTLALLDLDDMRVLRRSVRSALTTSPLDPDAVQDLILAIDEIVANAAEHGVPPVDVRLWCGQDRVLCAVTDRGPCFDGPLAGYGPAHGDMALGGMGLWLARRSVDDLVAAPDDAGGTGCTVRLVVNA